VIDIEIEAPVPVGRVVHKGLPKRIPGVDYSNAGHACVGVWNSRHLDQAGNPERIGSHDIFLASVVK
jgi:hypothetical protein